MATEVIIKRNYSAFFQRLAGKTYEEIARNLEMSPEWARVTFLKIHREKIPKLRLRRQYKP